MRLPGTRYQEHGWEHVRKLLGHCSLQAFALCPPARLLAADGPAATLALYVDLAGEALRDAGAALRPEAPGNSYGDTVRELAMSLVYELQARPADWSALCAAIASEHARLGPFWDNAGGDAILRKKVNDLFAVLRDKSIPTTTRSPAGGPAAPTRSTPTACSTRLTATLHGCSAPGRSTRRRWPPSWGATVRRSRSKRAS